MYKRYFFQNVVHCGYCNTDRCRACDYTGITPFAEFLRIHKNIDPIAAGVMYRACIAENFKLEIL